MFCLVASSHCPCLWGPSFALCSFQVTGLAFLWLLVIWMGSLFFPFFYFFLLNYSCVGVDNALIKGEIANTRLICALVVHFVMSDCQRDPQPRLSL